MPISYRLGSPRGVLWIVMATLFLLTFVNILNYLDRNLVQAVRPMIDADWHLSQAESGFLVSAFVVGYAFFSPVAGALSSRWHRPSLLALGVLVWSVGTCATGIATTQALFLLCRITVGIGESLFITVAATYLKDLLSCPIRITRGFSLFYAAIPVGSALGYVIGGWVAQWASWQTAFFIGGIPGFFLAPLVWRLPALNAPEVGNSANEEIPGTVSSIGPTYSSLVRQVLRSRSAVGIIAGYVANTFALAGLAANVSAHGLDLGFSIDEIGTRFGATLVVSGLIGTIAGGWVFSAIAHRTAARSRSMMISCAVTACLACPLLFFAFETTSPSLFIALCFVAELFIFAGTAPINSLLVTAVPTHLVSTTQGLSIASINLFGSFLAPILVGVVADSFSLRWGLHLCSFALALSGVIWFFTSSTFLEGSSNNGDIAEGLK
jgi:MFS family permease